MTLKTQIEAELPYFFNTDEFGEAATYNGTSITVVEASIEEINTSMPGFTIPLYTIYVKATDVARPKQGDSVSFRGVSCVVGPFPQEDGGVWLVNLEKAA